MSEFIIIIGVSIKKLEGGFMENTKPAWQSKTLLLNGVAGLVLFVSLFYPSAQVVTQLISKYPAEVGIGWSVLGMALRWVTKDKVVLTQ